MLILIPSRVTATETKRFSSFFHSAGFNDIDKCERDEKNIFSGSNRKIPSQMITDDDENLVNSTSGNEKRHTWIRSGLFVINEALEWGSHSRLSLIFCASLQLPNAARKKVAERMPKHEVEFSESSWIFNSIPTHSSPRLAVEKAAKRFYLFVCRLFSLRSRIVWRMAPAFFLSSSPRLVCADFFVVFSFSIDARIRAKNTKRAARRPVKWQIKTTTTNESLFVSRGGLLWSVENEVWEISARVINLWNFFCVFHSSRFGKGFFVLLAVVTRLTNLRCLAVSEMFDSGTIKLVFHRSEIGSRRVKWDFSVDAKTASNPPWLEEIISLAFLCLHQCCAKRNL